MKRLYKSRNKKIAGVLAGIGNYFSIDPSIIRIFYAMIALLTGIIPLLIVYIIAALFIPMEPRSNIVKNYKRLYRNPSNKILAGVLSGIADYLKIDLNIVRLIYIILFLITGVAPLLIGYFIAWVLIDEKPFRSNHIR
jgi:phage shock protein PspC (stress-responsive transcriptional regulator)